MQRQLALPRFDYMSPAAKERVKKLLRENASLRRHRRELINLLEHYREMAHHTFRERHEQRKANHATPKSWSFDG